MYEVDTREVEEVEPRPVEPRRRPWAVTAIGLLLVVQALGLFALGASYFAASGPGALQVSAGMSLEAALRQVLSSASLSLVYVPLSLLALLAAAGFFRLWRSAWTHAMLVQGLMLLIALLRYLGGRPWYVYLMMVYGIFLVIYLHYYDVKMAFLPGSSTAVGEERGCAEDS
jgi:hypothetical protein